MAQVVETIARRDDFPIDGEAYVVGKVDDGRYFFAWGPEYPFADEVPAHDIEAGESGLSYHETEEAARKEMLEAIRAEFENREPRKWYIDRVFIRNGEMHDCGFYLREDGIIEWHEPIPNGDIQEFPIEECTYEDGVPVDLDDGEAIGELITSKKDRIKQIFLEIDESDSDWSYAADKFVQWCISKDFQVESFTEFVEWMDDDRIGSVWDFWFGYGSDFEKFAEDWVEPEEIDDYLAYCREHA
ncbi:hypothetical protein [Caenibacillus caldisaponilyticus]|uniref:hypothetical protein n=2 Tax=Caenibacillus caldisaponilyticus TaxID=1674942 RepID=UPI00098842E1|nr:hypothetical protein [Caenibacillus caldisaponilyticus]